MSILSEIIVLFILSVFLLIHLLVILKIIPYSIVWGGRLKSDKEMYRFEGVSIILNILFILITLQKTKTLTPFLPDIILDITFWIMTLMFGINTIGNLFSKNKIEKIYFSFLSFILMIFCLLISIG